MSRDHFPDEERVPLGMCMPSVPHMGTLVLRSQDCPGPPQAGSRLFQIITVPVFVGFTCHLQLNGS